MIITISGRPGSGKSVVAKALAKRLDIPHFSAGDFERDLARKRKMDVVALSRLAETDRSINRMIDERTVELSHHEFSFVMDGRMAWKFIPSSVKVLLDVSLKEGGRRLKGREPRRLRSVMAAEDELRERVRCERAQYRAQYGVDFLAKKNYDVVIDTSKLSVDEVVDRILAFARERDVT